MNTQSRADIHTNMSDIECDSYFGISSGISMERYSDIIPDANFDMCSGTLLIWNVFWHNFRLLFWHLPWEISKFMWHIRTFPIIHSDICFNMLCNIWSWTCHAPYILKSILTHFKWHTLWHGPVSPKGHDCWVPVWNTICFLRKQACLLTYWTWASDSTAFFSPQWAFFPPGGFSHGFSNLNTVVLHIVLLCNRYLQDAFSCFERHELESQLPPVWLHFVHCIKKKLVLRY